MTYLRINAAQAAALRGKYGDWHYLDPIALPDTSDYILTDAVLSYPAFAAALAMLQALPTYPAWAVGIAYSVGDIREFAGRLKRCLQAHTSQADWSPALAPALWVTAHRDGETPAWWQPTGSHDAWPLSATVTHGGRVWLSLTAANVYEPGVIGTWRDQSSPPLWVAPAGAIGLWQVGDIAEYNGQTWRNTVTNNTWQPGVFGWVQV